MPDEFWTDFIGVYDEVDKVFMGQSNRSLMRDGASLDREMTGRERLAEEQDKLAGVQADSIMGDRARLRDLQSMFDREFFMDPKTKQFRSRRDDGSEFGTPDSGAIGGVRGFFGDPNAGPEDPARGRSRMDELLREMDLLRQGIRSPAGGQALFRRAEGQEDQRLFRQDEQSRLNQAALARDEAKVDRADRIRSEDLERRKTELAEARSANDAVLVRKREDALAKAELKQLEAQRKAESDHKARVVKRAQKMAADRAESKMRQIREEISALRKGDEPGAAESIKSLQADLQTAQREWDQLDVGLGFGSVDAAEFISQGLQGGQEQSGGPEALLSVLEGDHPTHLRIEAGERLMSGDAPDELRRQVAMRVDALRGEANMESGRQELAEQRQRESDRPRVEQEEAFGKELLAAGKSMDSAAGRMVIGQLADQLSDQDLERLRGMMDRLATPEKASEKPGRRGRLMQAGGALGFPLLSVAGGLTGAAAAGMDISDGRFGGSTSFGSDDLGQEFPQVLEIARRFAPDGGDDRAVLQALILNLLKRGK